MNQNAKPVKIVMIEDDEGHARLIEKNIRRAGVNNEIVPFADGTAALDYLLGADGSGDVSSGRQLLILLDLNLPDMTGIDIDAETIEVPTDKAVSIGVVVTELVTNAFKYAYADAHGGDIRVRFQRGPEQTIVLAVEDDGIGYRGEGAPKGTGVGSRVVAAMAQNLGATVDYSRGAGCRVRMTFAQPSTGA